MEKIMQIYGMELVKPQGKVDGSDKIVKLILVPWTTSKVKQKSVSFLDIARGGTESIFQEIMNKQQFKTEIHISMKEWLQEFKNSPFSHVKLILTLEKTAQEIADGL